MKQIFPIASKEKLQAVDQNKLDYETALAQSREAVEIAKKAECCVDKYTSDLSENVVTHSLNAENGTINNLNSNTAVVGDITVSDSIKATQADIECATISKSNTTCAEVEDASVNNAKICRLDNYYTKSHMTNADNINANYACFTCLRMCIDADHKPEVKLDGVEICSYWTKEDIHHGTINICDCTTINISPDSTVNLGEIDANEVNTDSLTSNTGNITDLSSVHADISYITHMQDAQEITEVANTGDYYILLPIYTNGFYLLEGRNDTDAKLFSVEVLNSINNIEFRWSEREIGLLQDIKYATDAAGHAIVQIHGNALNEHVTLYRQSISTSNTDAPTIYVDDQLPDVNLDDEKSGIIIKQSAGTYINNIIFTDKLHVKCLEMDALFMDCVGVYRKLFLTCDFNKSGDILEPIPTSGKVDQYVSNQLICNVITPTWTTPADRITTDCTNLVPTDVVANYTGEHCSICGYHKDYVITTTTWTEEERVRYNETTVDYHDWPVRTYVGGADYTPDSDYYLLIDGEYKRITGAHESDGEEAKYTVEGDVYYHLVSDYPVVYTAETYTVEIPDEEVWYEFNSADHVKIGWRISNNPGYLYYGEDGRELGNWNAYFKYTDVPDYTCYHPIVHLGDNTCVHGSIETECNSVVCCDETVCGNLVACTSFTSPHIGDTCDIECGLQIVQKQTTCTYLSYDSDRVVHLECPEDTFGNYVCQIGNCKYYDIPPEFNDWCVCYYLDGCDCGLVLLYDTPMRYFVQRYMPGYPGVPYDYWFAPRIVEEGEYNNTNARACRPNYSTCIAPYMECTCVIDSDLVLTRRNEDRCDELVAYNCECKWANYTDEDGCLIKPADTCLLRYNATTNTIEPTDEAILDDLTVCNLHVICDADIGNNLTVKGDLYVEGITHTVEEETVSTSSDMIVLRQNNPTTLTQGEVSGILVNNATADGATALVSDNTGTLRIGEPEGTDCTYDNLYYKDCKYYLCYDIETQEASTEVIPEGELTSWCNKAITDSGYTHYSCPTFTVFDYTCLSPVLARDEAENLTNDALLKWNAETQEANTIPVSCIDGASLKTCIYDDVCYHSGMFIRFTGCDAVYYVHRATTSDFYNLVNPSTYCRVESVRVLGDYTDCGWCVGFCADPSSSEISLPLRWSPDDGVYIYTDDGCKELITKTSGDAITSVCFRQLGTQRSMQYSYPLSCIEEVKLVCSSENCSCYYWSKEAGVYRFATMAAYEAEANTIPVNSVVIIDSCNNYAYSENRGDFEEEI